MSTAKKEPVLVVLQLSGANDYLNTSIPFADPLYRGYRPTVGIPEAQQTDGDLTLHPSMVPTKNMYSRGNGAIIHGAANQNSRRSHFRSMDIWHTCEPDTSGTEGWLRRVILQLNPIRKTS